MNKVYNRTLRQVAIAIGAVVYVALNFNELLETYGDYRLGAFLSNPVSSILSRFGTYSVSGGDDVDYDVSGIYATLSETLFNITINEIKDNLSGILGWAKAKVVNRPLGDYLYDATYVFVNDVLYLKINEYAQDNYEQNGEYTLGGNFKVLLEKTFNLNINEFINALSSEGLVSTLLGVYGDVKLGEIIGYFTISLLSANGCDLTIEDGEWKATGAFAKVINIIYNDTTVNDVYDYRQKPLYLVSEKLGQIMIGDLLGGYKENDVWYKSNGEPAKVSGDIQSVVLGKAYDITIDDILYGRVDIMALFGGIYIGDLMGYTLEFKQFEGEIDEDSLLDYESYYKYGDNYLVKEGGKYYYAEVTFDEDDNATVKKVIESVKKDGTEETNKIMYNLVTLTVNDLINSSDLIGTILNDVLLGEAIGATKDGDGNWTGANAIMCRMYDVDLGEVVRTHTIDLDKVLKGLSLGDVLGYDPTYTAGSATETYTLATGDIEYYTDSHGDVFIKDGETYYYATLEKDGETVVAAEKEITGWEKDGDKVKALNSSIADILMTDVLNGDVDFMELLGDLYIGEIMDYTVNFNIVDVSSGTLTAKDGYYEFDDGEKTINVVYEKGKYYEAEVTGEDDDKEITKVVKSLKKNDTTEEKGIMYNMLSLTIKSLKDNDNLIETILQGVLLGEAIGATKDGEVWKDKDDNAVDGVILNRMYDVDLGKVIREGKIDLDEVFDGLKLGEVLTYKISDGTVIDKNGDTIAAGKWYTGNEQSEIEQVSVINGCIADILMTEVINGDMDIIEALKDIEMGELMGYAKCTSDENCQIHDDVSECDGKWYKKDKCTADVNCPVHGDVSECDGKWHYEPIGILNARLSGITMDDVLHGKFDFVGNFGDVFIGDLKGYQKSVYKSYDAEPVTETLDGLTAVGADTVDGYDVYSKGGYYYATKDDSEYYYVKKVDLGNDGYEYLRVPASWDSVPYSNYNIKKTDAETTDEKNVYEIVAEGVDKPYCSPYYDENDGKYKYVFVEQIESDEEQKYVRMPKEWTTENETTHAIEPVTGLNAVMANIALGSVLSDSTSRTEAMIDDLKKDINKLTLGDVIAISDGDAKILTLIKDKEIGTLSESINALELGDIMGYEKKADGYWYKNDVKASNIAQAMAGTGSESVTVADMASDTFTNDLIDRIKATVEIKDIFGATSGTPLGLIPDTTKIGDISTTLKDAAQSADMGTMYDCGLLGSMSVADMNTNFTALHSLAKDTRTIPGDTMTIREHFTADIRAKADAASDVTEFWRSLTVNEMISCIGSVANIAGSAANHAS